MGNYSGKENLEAMNAAKRYNRSIVEKISPHLSSSSPNLDFGAGQGLFAGEFQKRGWNVVCHEIDSELQQTIRQKGLCLYDASQNPDNQAFDVVYSINVLEHIEDDVLALKNIKQLLKPQGKLVLYVPAFNILFSAMDHLVGHHRRYTRESLTSRLEEAGFQVVESKYSDSLGFFISLIFKWIGDKDGKVSEDQIRIYDRYVFPISQICDRILSKLLGKNVFIVATSKV